ncbi:hypothetical protein D3C71_1826870 [compost metagenome]
MSTRAFGDALRDRQIGLMGKDKAGLTYRGPIRLKTIQEMADEGVTERPSHATGAPAGLGDETLPAGDPTDPDAYWRAAEADESPFG